MNLFLLLRRICIPLVVVTCGTLLQADEKTPPFRVIGYLPYYQFHRLDLEHAGLLDELMLFSAEPTASGTVDLGRLAAAPWDTLWKLRERSHTRLILCLGGWSKSSTFSQVVQQPDLRMQLVKSVLQVLHERRLDGIDIDWEYPRTVEDWNGYLALLQELKAEFAGRKLSLSITVAPSRELPDAAWKLADSVQLMSYDYGRQHSTPQQAEQDIQAALDRGIPPGKLVLGMPFYGRNVMDRKAYTYAQLVNRHDPAADADEIAGIYYNSPATIRRKTRAALQAGIGGVMVWEIGQDVLDERSLLREISRTVREKHADPMANSK